MCCITFSTICRPKISPPKVIYKVQSMPYKSLPLGAFWTICGRSFPTGVLQLLYPYQPANPLVESIFKALKCLNFQKKNRKNVLLDLLTCFKGGGLFLPSTVWLARPYAF